MNYLGQNIKKILPGNVAVGGANMGMVPLFAVMWCPNRAGIWAGYVAADGQELSQNLYPDAFSGIGAGNVPTTSASNWLSDPTARGAYVEESSPGMFRVPDLNGKFAGSLGAVFLRGDGTLSAGIDGLIQRDAFQGHWHSAGGSGSGSGIAGVAGTIAYTALSGQVRSPISDDTNGTPRTASETRPLNVTGCWVIKLFGAVTNVGSADAAQLASDYASAMARIGQLELTERLPLGFGQTWQDVTSRRALATTYTNSTGRPIQVMITANWSDNTDNFNFFVDGVAVLLNMEGGFYGWSSPVAVIVPAGSTYSITANYRITANYATPIKRWMELR